MKLTDYLVFTLLFCFACLWDIQIFANDKYDFFKGEKTSIKNPFMMRDPFKRLRISGAAGSKTRLGGLYKDGAYSNMPTIDGVPLENIKITGVMLGKNRRAIAKVDGSKDTFILKEGMKLGLEDSILKAILPGGIVLVEKIQNVYDQYEYLETLIPIEE